MSVAAVVLAAGEASRFGAPKQKLLLPTVLARLREAPVDEIVVAEGAYPLGGLCGSEPLSPPAPAGGAGPQRPDASGSEPQSRCRVVRCAEWARGPGASLRCGLDALGPEVDAAVVVLADGPNLSPDAVARVLGAWRSEGGVVAASYGGARGHPLVLGRDAWKDVPDGGMHERPARLVPCDDLGAPGDVDRPEDLRA